MLEGSGENMVLTSVRAIEKSNELQKVGKQILEFNMSIYDRIVVYMFMDKFYIYTVTMNEYGDNEYTLKEIDETVILPLLSQMRTVLSNPISFNF